MDLLVIILFCHVLIIGYIRLAVIGWCANAESNEGKEDVRGTASHHIAYKLGQALTELPVNKSYSIIKSEVHPTAIEYYLRTKGENVKVVDVQERPKLKLVK
ncbi:MULTISPECIES: hypothetical protein [Pseudoalteromonas]|uniref:hypothetical protein n=1 Tax=Pseudoalteromonas TaxID=53246 RepID=UPI00110BE19D|nr:MULTISPECIES: hypothetical protein [Pseudoalteromonas]QZO12623.1 hypothetical protein K5642_16310 [Pseudoalteromonas piscicida]TMN45971.1 hypothetical protein CWC03_00785 [Pseudoalteromonas sp. S2755]